MEDSDGRMPSVIEEITAKISALTADELLVPTAERKEGEVVLGHADGYLQRLYTVQAAESNHLSALKAEGIEIAQGMTETLLGGGTKLQRSISAMFELLSATAAENNKKAGRLDEIEAALKVGAPHCQLLHDLFWIEARRRIPVLNDHPHIGLRSDWSIVVAEKKSGIPPELEELFSSLGGLGLGGFRFGGAIDLSTGREVDPEDLPPEVRQMMEGSGSSLFGRRRRAFRI